MDHIFEQIGKFKLVPVVKIERAADSLALGNAFLAGGLPLAEITFRTDAAQESIRILSKSLPEMLIGAGTVLKVDNVKKAIQAGAKFIVAPGFNPKVVDYCIENGIPVIPGVNSPSQIEMGLDRDLSVLKYFPAEASGGLKLLKAMAEVYGDVKYIPTGGISADNLLEYLSFNRVIACGGTWIAKSNLISEGRFDEITRLTRQAVELIATLHAN
jgi:2-dehydro-3-deoxyphosphogluconate aldolase/(4S)-4-hydroxy-2-oxoglutarate aldolase